MATLTATSMVENGRGVTFQVTGDGASTAISIAVTRPFLRPNRTIKAYLVTSPTIFFTRSERGGLLAPVDGTAVTVSSATDNDNNTLTVNTSSAIGNGTVAYGTAIYDQYTH